MSTPLRPAAAYLTRASITSSLKVELRRLTRSGLGLGVLVAFAFFGLSSPVLSIYMPEILGAAASTDQLAISASQATPADAISLFNQSAMQLGLIVTVAVAITSIGWDAPWILDLLPDPGTPVEHRPAPTPHHRLAHRAGNVLVRPAARRRCNCQCDRTSTCRNGDQDMDGLRTLHRHGDEYRPPDRGKPASDDDGDRPDHAPGPRPAGDEPGTGNVPLGSHCAAPTDGAACDASGCVPGRHRTVRRRKRPHCQAADAPTGRLAGLVGQNDLDGRQTPRCLPPIYVNHQFGYLTGAAGGYR